MKKLSVFLATVMLFTMLATALALPASAVTTVDSVLNGKSALFVGDSIMTGYRDTIDGSDKANGRGWGYRIRDAYEMTVDIAAIAGRALSTVRGEGNEIYQQLYNNRNNSYDYIILEGGFNDIMGNTTTGEPAPLGSKSDSYDLNSFGRSTFAGALEHLLCYATTNFPNAKIGFIVTFETPFSTRGNGTNVRETTKQYFDLAKEICDKWNVPYLDFYDGTEADGTPFYDIFYPNNSNSTYFADDIHPNKAGYDATYGYVAQWMATLPVYTAPLATANTSVLDGETAMFAGDSITEGYGELLQGVTVRSWVQRIGSDCNMTVKNNGKSGHSLSDVRDYTAYGNIDKRLHVKCFDTSSYNYVILQGGVNDIIGAEENKGHPNPGVGVQIGSIAATKDPDDFDTSTFAGGLERYFYEATTRYPNAKLGFIITYQTPNAQPRWGIDEDEAAPYWQIAREICAKWDIPYLDLFDDSYSNDILDVDNDACPYLDEDALHLNAAGYDAISPYIAKWMATLPQYVGNVNKDVNDSTGTPTGTEYHYTFDATADGFDYAGEYYKDHGSPYYYSNNCIVDANGVKTELVNDGYNGSAQAMKMSYTANLEKTEDKQYYASFSMPNTYTVNKYGRKPGQSIHLEKDSTFTITVRYKVTGYTSVGALYACFGKHALSNIPTFSQLSPVKIADIVASTSTWQTAQIICTPTADVNLYISLKMADDTNRAGTEVLIGSVDIVPTVPPLDTSEKGTIEFDSQDGTAVESITGTVGTTITYPANPTKDGYDFVNWYTKDYIYSTHNNLQDNTEPDKFTEGTTRLFARWKAKSTGTVYPGTEYHYTFDNAVDLYNYESNYYKNTGTDAAPEFHNNAMWEKAENGGATAKLVSGGYGSSTRAMQMAYTANLAETKDQQHYAAFSLPNNTGAKKNGRATTQTINLEHSGTAYALTVTYKVTDYQSPAALYFALGLGALGDDGAGTEIFSNYSRDKIVDITNTTDDWQTATIIIDPTERNGAYLVLKMDDDTNRAGTEVLIGAVDIVPIDATQVVTVTFDTDGGSDVWPVRGYMHAAANYPVPTKSGYAFTGWYTADGAAAPTTFPTVDTTYYAEWAAPTIKVDSVVADTGDTISVNVRIAYNPGIISAKTAIGYDKSNLELINAEAADFTGVEFGPLDGDNLYINWMDPLAESNNTADGVLAVLTFRVKDDAAHGDTEITVSYDPDDVFDYDLNNVTFETENGTVTVHTYDNASDAKCNDCDVTREADSSDLKITATSLSLHNNLTVNYKIDSKLLEKQYTDIKMVFEFNDKIITLTEYELDVTQGRLVFKFRDVAANRMGDTIKSTVYATYNGETYRGTPQEYSITKYCENMLGKSEDAKLRTLLVDLLNYGALSQQYTDYKTNDLVTGILTDEQKTWGTSETLELKSVLNVKHEVVENPIVQWQGAGLVLKDSVTIRYILAASDFDGLTFKVSAAGKEWELTADDIEQVGEQYRLCFSGLNANELSEKVLITAYKGNVAVSNTVCYSVESYAHSKQNDTEPYLADLVKAMMKYGNSAYAYTAH